MLDNAASSFNDQVRVGGQTNVVPQDNLVGIVTFGPGDDAAFSFRYNVPVFKVRVSDDGIHGDSSVFIIQGVQQWIIP